MSREFGQCERCNKYQFDAQDCKCTEYTYWIDGWSNEDEPEKIYSSYESLNFVAEDIAAKHYDKNGEYDVEEFEEYIYIKDSEGEYIKFRTLSEVEIVYVAKEIK